MSSRPDHIPIRRQSPAERPVPEDTPSSGGQQRPVRTTKEEREKLRRVRIASVLFGLIAVMILIALLTYTSRDEANAQLSLRDIMGVIRGDDALRVRFDTTYNWLGLLGAVISHWMYTSTIGVWSLCIPVLMLFWARDVYRIQRISPLLTRYSIVTIAAGILMAGFVGTLQLVPAFVGIDRVWCGAVGQFLAAVLSQFIGTIGSSLLHLVALAMVVVFGYNVNTARLSVASTLMAGRMKGFLANGFSRRTTDGMYDDETGAGDDAGEHTDADGPEAPETANARSTPGTRTAPPPASASSGNAPAPRGTILRPFLSGKSVQHDTPHEQDLPIDLPSEPPIPYAPPQHTQQPVDLAPGVRILRSTRRTETNDIPPADGPSSDTAPFAPQPLHAGTGLVPQAPASVPPPSAAEPRADAAMDLDLVQRRLQALHPNREVNVKRDAGPTDPGPSDPGDPPELPLFLQDDEDDFVEPDLPPPPVAPKQNRADILRPLTVTVEENAQPEPEVQLPSSTLYDEHIVYKPPTGNLLVDIKEDNGITDEELQENARLLQEKLETFRIKIENLTVQPGPVVTQYEFVPAAGIKLSQIESLSDDIALALKAQGVRIIAPIPGRGTVGIEIPNNRPATVRFSTIVKSPKYHNPDIKLPIAMGKTVVGEVYCADLTKMPHLLIAGATGKGKSVGINTIIASLIFKMHPRDLKFVIVDPKRVEMTLYAALKNHFLAVSPDINETIITEPQNAVTVLKAVVEEMQQRYSILAAAGQRNIADYNRKAKEGVLKNRGGIEHRPIPYIVVIIDELADLMMTAGKEVEDPIVRLAQLARAVGIHCIVATQRPSVDVVTGLIKANFPARIAYQVASRIDSRTILDTSGAEHLIGNGDMLFNPGTLTKPLRMQNAFISTEEVEAMCEWIGKQKGYSSPYMLPSVNSRRGGGSGGNSDDRDALFEDAARTFIQLQQASVSTLQRRLKVGYARAARIVDELEMAGIVGPPDGSKGRQVLLQSESELEAYL